MRPKLLVVVVAVLNLVAGASFGWVAGRETMRPGPRDVAPALDPALPTLAAALDLPADRDAKVRAILASCGPRFDEVMKDVRPKLRALHEQILGELSQVLTRKELDRLAEEFHRRYGEGCPTELR